MNGESYMNFKKNYVNSFKFEYGVLLQLVFV